MPLDDDETAPLIMPKSRESSSDSNSTGNILLCSSDPPDGLPGFNAKQTSDIKSVVKQSIGSVAFSLANATVGAGIIGLPFAFRQAGLLFGIFLAIWVAFLTNLSLNLMVQAGRLVRKYQYANLARYSLGVWFGSVPTNLAVIGNGIGSMISYLSKYWKFKYIF